MPLCLRRGRDDVRQAAEQLSSDGPERDRRVLSLEGLVHEGDKPASLFADVALRECRQGRISDWRAVESRFLLLCEGSGVERDAAVKALIEHSPGATSLLRQQSIRDEALLLFAVPERTPGLKLVM